MRRAASSVGRNKRLPHLDKINGIAMHGQVSLSHNSLLRRAMKVDRIRTHVTGVGRKKRLRPAARSPLSPQYQHSGIPDSFRRMRKRQRVIESRNWSFSSRTRFDFVSCITQAHNDQEPDMMGGAGTCWNHIFSRGSCFDGLLSVMLPGYPRAMDSRMIQATVDLPDEFSFNEDYNSGYHLGIGWEQSTVHNGTRSSSETAFNLGPKYLSRLNLHVLIHSYVTRILESNCTTKGVKTFDTMEFTQDAGETIYTLSPAKEILLSVGSIGAPHILLYSGIGDADELSPVGITPVHLPDVGKNLTDHPSTDTIENIYLRNETFQRRHSPNGRQTVQDISDITINSTNPLDSPLINPNLLGHPQDLTIMQTTINTSERSVTAPAWDGYILKFVLNTTEAAIREGADTLWHPVDKTGILACRKHGVELPLSAYGLGKIFRVVLMSEWVAGAEGCYGAGYTLHVLPLDLYGTILNKHVHTDLQKGYNLPRPLSLRTKGKNWGPGNCRYWSLQMQVVKRSIWALGAAKTHGHHQELSELSNLVNRFLSSSSNMSIWVRLQRDSTGIKKSVPAHNMPTPTSYFLFYSGIRAFLNFSAVMNTQDQSLDFDIDQKRCVACLSNGQGQHSKRHTELEKMSDKIESQKRRVMRIVKKMGMTGNSHDDVALFNNVCRKGGRKDAKFLTEHGNLKKQYFRLLSRLAGPHPNVTDRPLSAGPSYHVNASRSWAVVIRIDGYETISALKGGVKDAQSFYTYLIDVLAVPRERIQLLLGSTKQASPDDSTYTLSPPSPSSNPDNAMVTDNSLSPGLPIYPSRAHIINTLLSLINNPHIEKDDNIIIYYAGHGSSYECSEYKNVDNPEYEEEISFASTGHIEALCPIDRDTCDANGNPVPDISDREFNTILTLISRAKGHHITVILNCCHSAGVSRDVPPSGARTCRGTERASLRDMLHAGEKNLEDFPGCPSILSKDWYPDEGSHILLAACEVYQYAKERWVDGVQVGIFTHSLLRLLRSGYCNAETTYLGLTDGFDKSYHQTPVIAGTHRDEHLWYQVDILLSLFLLIYEMPT
ncbi:GMC oxidoreductase-domain-containing protein [Desarmillaria tabescens]|uniref:GMC oxidoreductase-domain-containing protein n=1 Tax=Armillaria tabescens TaxID=1929756 RepID=A0AA39NAZ4_ARMTA|nr:GMC oxidoreductase-domain-containing protein [Desarmillaria tabescens]KAK0462291.1 GMC oxidoreductase-domain-containing protein [Desarmillaria tabescens]